MTSGRRVAGVAVAVGWLSALAGAVAALQASGRGGLAPPPLAHPDQWQPWLSGREPVVAAFALLRLAGMAAVWYLVAATGVGFLLRFSGAVRMVAVADRVTIAPVRRMLAGTVSLGLAASGLVGVIGPAARLPMAFAQSAPPQAATAPPGTVTMHQLSPTDPSPAPPVTSTPPATSNAPKAGPAADSSAGPWTVAPGQCFWSIAEAVLTTHLGRSPTEAEIVPYWERLIDANRSELAHRDNADLIFPGQIFAVPAP
ncbi:MAG: hypothetical protein M3066_10375 [Actinomycetota bacterium]|nr:hypothetical protein [Actinomycetota bacterium]